MGYTASKGSRDSTRCNFPFNFSTIESRTGINCATCDRNYRFLTEKERKLKKKVYLRKILRGEKKKKRREQFHLRKNPLKMHDRRIHSGRNFTWKIHRDY